MTHKHVLEFQHCTWAQDAQSTLNAEEGQRSGSAWGRGQVWYRTKAPGISLTLQKLGNLRQAAWLLCACSVSFLLKQLRPRESTWMEGGSPMKPILPGPGQELTQWKPSLTPPPVIFLPGS